MLKKLMHYDFKSVFKLWWIAALSTFILSLVGGGISTFLTANFFTDKKIPIPIIVVAVIVLVMVFIGFAAFAVFSEILVYLRFYKNLYSDEGYLTFTLPAKRGTILNSKVLLGFVTTMSTLLVLGLNSTVMLVISCHKYIFTKEFLKHLSYFINEFLLEYEYNYFIIIYLIEAIVLCALIALTSLLFAYVCITVASVIAKKGKILVAVGIYYGATSLLSSVMSIFYLFGITSLIDVFSKLSEGEILCCLALLVLIVILILSAVSCMLYYITHWCLHKKLNLA